MKNCFYLFILLLLTSTITFAKTAKVTGTISSAKNGEVQLDMYADLITFEPMQYTSYLTDKNTFEFEVVLRDASIATLSHGNGKLEIFIEPGDSLHLEFDAWDIATTVEFSGNCADNNQYLTLANKRFQRINDDFVIYKMSRMSPNEFKRYMDTVRQKKLALFRRYDQVKEFSPVFEDYALADVHYWWAYNLMRYRYEHPHYNGLPTPMDLPDSYFDFLDDIDVKNEGAVTNLKYIFFIDQFLAYQNSKKKKRADMQNRYFKVPKYRGAEFYLTGKPLYYIIANDLFVKCKNDQTYAIGNDVKRFMDECPFEEYKNIVQAEFKKANGLSAGIPAPEFTLVDQMGKTVSLADFRGKVVYMDFWATWCPPCKYEILRSGRLKERFKDKDVIFLYISLDSNPQSWKNFLNKHRPKGVHLFASGVYRADVATKYSVRGLPSFFLIDRAGTLARVPAKRSTEPGVDLEIENVLYGK